MDRNECINRTKKYLQNYRRWKAEAVNLGNEAREIESILSDAPAAAIAKYGDEPGGGTPDLNVIEQSAERRMKLEERLDEITTRKQQLDNILARVDTALGALNEYLRDLLVMHYVDGRQWTQIAAVHYYSERWTREQGHMALALTAEMIFGLWIS